jgi:hypothetical protein
MVKLGKLQGCSLEDVRLLLADTGLNERQRALYYQDFLDSKYGGFYGEHHWYQPRHLFTKETLTAPFRPGTNIGALFRQGKVKINIGINLVIFHVDLIEFSGRGISLFKTGVGIGTPGAHVFVAIDENTDSRRWSARGFSGGIPPVGAGVEEKFLSGEQLMESKGLTYSVGLFFGQPGVYFKGFEVQPIVIEW